MLCAPCSASASPPFSFPDNEVRAAIGQGRRLLTHLPPRLESDSTLVTFPQPLHLSLSLQQTWTYNPLALRLAGPVIPPPPGSLGPARSLMRAVTIGPGAPTAGGADAAPPTIAVGGLVRVLESVVSGGRPRRLGGRDGAVLRPDGRVSRIEDDGDVVVLYVADPPISLHLVLLPPVLLSGQHKSLTPPQRGAFPSTFGP